MRLPGSVLLFAPFLVASAVAAEPVASPAEPGPLPPARYAIAPESDGFVRLDTRTGSLSHCRKQDQKWVCDVLIEDQTATERRLGALADQLAGTDRRLTALTARAAANELRFAELADEVGRLSARVDGIAEQIARLRAQLDDLTGRISPAAPPKSRETAPVHAPPPASTGVARSPSPPTATPSGAQPRSLATRLFEPLFRLVRAIKAQDGAGA